MYRLRFQAIAKNPSCVHTPPLAPIPELLRRDRRPYRADMMTQDTPLAAELVERLVARDGKALSVLYKLTVDHLFGIAYKILHSKKIALDVMSNVYEHAWNNASLYIASHKTLLEWLEYLTHAMARVQKRRIADAKGGWKQFKAIE